MSLFRFPSLAAGCESFGAWWDGGGGSSHSSPHWSFLGHRRRSLFVLAVMPLDLLVRLNPCRVMSLG